MKPHLSISQIGMLQRCGKQYEFRYLEGIKSPPGVALVIGKGTHGAVEQDLGNFIEWGELLPDEAIADFAAESTRKEWQKEPPTLQDGDPDEGGAVDTAVALAQVHHREVAPRIEPVAVERGFRLELPDFSHDLVGYIDIEEPHRIRDTKTSGKTPPADAADVSDQLTLYHLDATVRGKEIKAVALDYLVKTKVAKAVTLESPRGPQDHARLLRKVEAAAAVIKAGNFMPAPADFWGCSPKWCGYWDRCDYGAKKKVSVGLIDVSRLISRLEERRP